MFVNMFPRKVLLEFKEKLFFYKKSVSFQLKCFIHRQLCLLCLRTFIYCNTFTFYYFMLHSLFLHKAKDDIDLRRKNSRATIILLGKQNTIFNLNWSLGFWVSEVTQTVQNWNLKSSWGQDHNLKIVGKFLTLFFRFRQKQDISLSFPWANGRFFFLYCLMDLSSNSSPGTDPKPSLLFMCGN